MLPGLSGGAYCNTVAFSMGYSPKRAKTRKVRTERRVALKAVDNRALCMTICTKCASDMEGGRDHGRPDLKDFNHRVIGKRALDNCVPIVPDPAI